MEKIPFDIPSDRHYDPHHHMWAKIDAVDGVIIVGIDAFGLDALGDLAYVSLRPAGISVRRGEPLGSLEAAKMTGDIISPISGKVVSINDALLHNPAILNRDPYTQGWIAMLIPDAWSKESGCMVAGERLPAWVKEETRRYHAQGLPQ